MGKSVKDIFRNYKTISIIGSGEVVVDYIAFDSRCCTTKCMFLR